MADIKKTISTRIILRNDDLSNWEKSEKVLLKGEAALAKRADGLYEIRIGDGEHVWKDLSATGFGHTKFFEKTSFDELSVIQDAPNGSIGIVTEEIANGKFSKTAYSFNDTMKRWEALDGNYSAENVYFKDDITLAGDYTAVGNIKLSEGELPAAGKSVKTLMDNIFTKELYPSKTLPSYTFASSSSQGAKEVGDTYAVPGATFTYTGTGSYTYDPKDAACKVSANSVTIARTTSGEEATKTNSAEIVKNGTLALDNGSAGVTFLDYESRKTYSFTCTASHSEGVMPKTNLGNDYPTARISAADGWSSGPTTASATYYGYRNFWIGSVADGTTAIDETFVKKNLKAFKSAAKNFQVTSAGSSSTSGYERIELVAGAKRIILVLPAAGHYKRTRKQVLLKSASNTPITDSYVSIG